MTEDVQLDSVWAKLHRADERAQTLQGELASFVHLYEHCIEVVRNADATRHEVLIHFDGRPDYVRWGLILVNRPSVWA